MTEEIIDPYESPMLNLNRCPSCGKEGEDLHTCPYQSDIYNDDEFQCNCCSDCEHQCAMDV